MLVQQVNSCQCFHCRHIACAGHYYIRFAIPVITGPLPNANSGAAVFDSRIHVQPLWLVLFSGNDDINKIPAAKALVCYIKQGVGIRREKNTDDIGFFIHHEVDKARILVRKAVVVLSPDM